MSDEILEIAIPETNNLTIEDIRLKIAKCAETEDGLPLQHAMRDLKVALKQNPAACRMMLDEDIGKCVEQLTRMVNKEILAELSDKPAKKEKVVYTKEQIDNLKLSDLL